MIDKLLEFIYPILYPNNSLKSRWVPPVNYWHSHSHYLIVSPLHIKCVIHVAEYCEITIPYGPVP